MKMGGNTRAAINNKIYTSEEDQIAKLLKEKNLDYTNRKWPMPTPCKSFYTEYVKRILDLLIAVPVFVLLLPIYAIISLSVLFNLGRPVLYKQTRVGKNGRKFDIYKFRSMNNDKNEKGELLPPQQRVTRFGRIIRKLSLDELIELYNVIKGDMSIIGPRPLPVFYVDRMSNRHKMRHSVRPGLECPRVIQLDYPYTCKYQQTFENDVWYVEHISFLQDIKMFLLLIKMVFSFEKRGQQAAVQGISYFLGYDENGLAISMRTYKEALKEGLKDET